MVTVPTVEPTEFFAGDTVAWRREDLSGDFPANASWVLTYYLRGPSSPAAIVASASGVYFAVSIAASVTKDWNEGVYWWAARVTKAAEEYTVGQGTFLAKKNFALSDAVYDGRSHAKATLDALEATIRGLAAEPLQQYSISQQTAIRQRLLELEQMRKSYKAEYQAEQDAAAAAAGTPRSHQVKVVFDR